MILHKEDFDAIRDLIKEEIKKALAVGSPQSTEVKPVAVKAEKEKK